MLIESSAGDDGHSSLQKLPKGLSRREVDVDGEEQVLSGRVEIDRQFYLVTLSSCYR